MKSIITALMLILLAQLAIAQSPTYEMILANDTVVSTTVYEFDIVPSFARTPHGRATTSQRSSASRYPKRH